MSTPALAGHLALVRQYFVEGYYPSGEPDALNRLDPSASLLKAIAINSAFSIPYRQNLVNDFLVRENLETRPNKFAVSVSRGSSCIRLTKYSYL